MIVCELSARHKLMAGSNVSVGAKQRGYGDVVSEYDETNGGWEE